MKLWLKITAFSLCGHLFLLPLQLDDAALWSCCVLKRIAMSQLKWKRIAHLRQRGGDWLI